MIITCPECGFERQVNPDKIPARSCKATCPKCKTKFQFRELPDEFDFMDDAPQEAPRDVSPQQSQAQPEEETDTLSPAEKLRAKAREHAAQTGQVPAETPVAPTPPAPEEKPDLLPGLEDPAKDKHEELWDTLGGMTPPEEKQHDIPQDGESPSEEPQQDISQQYDPDEFLEDTIRMNTDKKGAGYDDAPLPPWAQKKEDKEEASLPGGMDPIKPPFEDLEHFGFFPGIFETLRRIILAPRMFFDRMPLGNGVGRPLVFALLILVVQDIFQAVYQLSGIVPPPMINGEMLQMPTDMSMGYQLGVTLLFSPVLWTVALFVLAGIHHAILVLLRASSGGFEATFRGVAYSVIPLMLALIPQVNDIISQGLYVVTSSWSMVLVIIAWQSLHRTSFLKAGLAAIMPALIVLLVLFAAQGAVPTV